MNRSRKRAITWTLVALGIAIMALGGVLAATFPWSQGMSPFASPTGTPPTGVPLPGGWYGYHHGWGFMHGPRFFGGGLLIIVLVILLISFAVRRWRHGGYYYGREGRLDAEEILRRTFAEGRITEEEYKSRLDALRK